MIKVQGSEHAFKIMKNAARRGHPVTVTYTRQDGSTTVRTIEVYEFTRNKAGDRYVKAMVRTENPAGELRSFRLDRVVFATVHRTHYLLTVPVPKSAQFPVMRPQSEILHEMYHGTPAVRTPHGTGSQA